MTTKRCMDCRYYQKMDELTGKGICRRYPPQAYGLRNICGTLWPNVYEYGDWCGEFQEKEER